MLDSNINDAELSMRVKNDNDENALAMLIDRHSGICYRIYSKYFQNNHSARAKDVESEKDSLIYHAAKTYNPDCGAKFSTWLGNIITYACLNACSYKKREVAVDDQVLNFLADSNHSYESAPVDRDAELLKHIRELVELSGDDVSKEVIKMRYLSGDRKVKTFKEIAEHFGVSTQTVVNWHDKFIAFLKNKLRSDNTLDIV